jgi:hypothetical protein
LGVLTAAVEEEGQSQDVQQGADVDCDLVDVDDVLSAASVALELCDAVVAIVPDRFRRFPDLMVTLYSYNQDEQRRQQKQQQQWEPPKSTRNSSLSLT